MPQKDVVYLGIGAPPWDPTPALAEASPEENARLENESN